jgi:hypothetical protein
MPGEGAGRALAIIPRPGPAAEITPRFSPDGKWIAYSSNESGASEVWVAAFPPTGARWQVTRGGGTQPRWRGDGRELFFIAPGLRLMAVPVATNERFQAGSPTELFPIGLSGGGGRDYEVSRDGRRILAVVNRATIPRPFTVVLNWPARLPGGS